MPALTEPTSGRRGVCLHETSTTTCGTLGLLVRDRRSLTLAVTLVAACGRLGFDPGAATDAATDATPADTVTRCTLFGPFSTPVLVAELNTPEQDWAPSISPDGLTIYFSQRDPINKEELFRGTRASPTQPWTIAPLTELSTADNFEDDPTVSSDGREIFYGKGTMYRATRASAALPFSPPLSTFSAPAGFESVNGFELSSDDLTLYFTMREIAGRSSMFVMKRSAPLDSFGSFVPLLDPDPIGDAGWPTISADELELFFTSDHNGQRDIWTSRRMDAASPFPQATLVTELSSSSSDWDPELSLDGTTLWLASDRGGGGTDQNIYVATRTCL
jgi:hypothetical protein